MRDETNLGLSRGITGGIDCMKNALYLGGLGLSRVLSATSRRHFPSEEERTHCRGRRVIGREGPGVPGGGGPAAGDDAGHRLGRGLSEGLARWRAPRSVHDPGKIITDLAAALALRGDCLADIAVLREQPGLAGPVASDPVLSRLVRSLAAGWSPSTWTPPS